MTHDRQIFGERAPAVATANSPHSCRWHVPATHHDGYAGHLIRMLVVAIILSAGAAWLAGSFVESSRGTGAVEVAPQAETWAGWQGESYPRNINTDVAEVFSYSGL